MPCMCGDADCPSCGVAQGTRIPSGDAETYSPLPWSADFTPPNGAVVRDAEGLVVCDDLRLWDANYIIAACNGFGGLVHACETLLSDRNARVHLSDRTLETVAAALNKALGK